MIATAYQLEAFSGSPSYTNASPTTTSHTSLYSYVVASNTTILFEHGRYSLHMFFPTSHPL